MTRSAIFTRTFAPLALLSLPISPAVAGLAPGAELYLNELYFDPPGSSGDDVFEYIELRGTPGMSLDNHYLLFLESEGQEGGNGAITGSAGELDAWFDLSGQTMGSNGFLTLRQADGFFAPNPYVVAPGATDLKQGVQFTGWGTVGSGSTIGWNSDGFKIENGAFSALIVAAEPVLPNPAFVEGSAEPELLAITPITNFDYDQGNDGLDTLPEGWSIVDGIGVAEEGEAEFARLYAPVNYGAFESGQPVTGTNLEPDAVFIPTDFEIEYVARLGDSTGQTAGDWWAGNLTDNLRAPGFENLPDNPPNFRLSAADGPQGDQTGAVESSTDQFAYATIVTNHLGTSNPGVPEGVGGGIPGDYDDSGQVEQGDLNLVLSDWGGAASFEPNGDPFVTALVDQEELNRVLSNWGSTAAPSFAGSNVPEPAVATLALGVACALKRRRR
ncbi:MAG: hypothetical protein AAGJ38_02280 [Planctomycetota bacterium]